MKSILLTVTASMVLYSCNGSGPSNGTPTANAGTDVTSIVGQTVTLNGSGSTDPDSDTLTYQWSVTTKPAGSAAALSDTASVTPTFTPDKAGEYVLSLTVNDGQASSTADSVTVQVSALNRAPTANAGTDVTSIVGQTVTLNGSGSTDPDSDTLTYQWSVTTKPAGSAAALSDTASVTPTFTPDKAGEYVLSLTVNDGQTSSTANSVTIKSYTPLSGILKASQSLTLEHSPYMMVEDVSVPAGMSLQVAEGVSIRGNNRKLIVEGTLNMIGVSNNTIYIENIIIEPAGKYQYGMNSKIEMNYVIMKGGSLYSPTGNGHYGSLKLRNSKIYNIPYIYLWYPLGDNIIDRNLFVGSGGISFGVDYRYYNNPVNLSITNNTFKDWTTPYAIQNWTEYGDKKTTISGNNFISSYSNVAISLPNGYDTARIDATGNYWGTTDEKAISSMIYDRNDSINVSNYVPFVPFLPVANPDAPSF